MDGFSEGYSFFCKNAEGLVASSMSNNYIRDVENAIDVLKKDLNTFDGFKTNPGALKGDIAEFWHSDSFNIDAIVKGTNSRTFVDRSHGFASADISSNFGKEFGLKYYNTGADSARQQAKSVFERFNEYKSQGGKDSLDEFLTKRGYNNIDKILNDPIYSGQVRVIPKDQIEEATAWLQRKIIEEGAKRSEQRARYQETLDMLSDRVKDSNGTESIALSKEDAEKLAKLAKEGGIDNADLAELGISTEELIKYEYIMKQAFKAGITSATISVVLKVAPELFKAISYLIKNGKIKEDEFKRIGFLAIQGGSEGFLRGSISAAITTACKAGLWGNTMKNINPSVVGAAVVVLMDTMKNSFRVAAGKMESRELAQELVKEMYVSAFSLVTGGLMQGIIEVPIIGFMLGSFIGTVVGSFTYNAGYKAFLSFCVDTGFTCFGLVDQNYELPEEVLKQIGVNVFEYERFKYNKFKPNKFTFKKFEPHKLKYDTIGIKPLRRGVIGVQRIGYI